MLSDHDSIKTADPPEITTSLEAFCDAQGFKPPELNRFSFLTRTAAAIAVPFVATFAAGSIAFLPFYTLVPLTAMAIDLGISIFKYREHKNKLTKLTPKLKTLKETLDDYDHSVKNLLEQNKTYAAWITINNMLKADPTKRTKYNSLLAKLEEDDLFLYEYHADRKSAYFRMMIFNFVAILTNIAFGAVLHYAALPAATTLAIVGGVYALSLVIGGVSKMINTKYPQNSKTSYVGFKVRAFTVGFLQHTILIELISRLVSKVFGKQTSRTTLDQTSSIRLSTSYTTTSTKSASSESSLASNPVLSSVGDNTIDTVRYLTIAHGSYAFAILAHHASFALQERSSEYTAWSTSVVSPIFYADSLGNWLLDRMEANAVWEKLDPDGYQRSRRSYFLSKQFPKIANVLQALFYKSLDIKEFCLIMKEQREKNRVDKEQPREINLVDVVSASPEVADPHNIVKESALPASPLPSVTAPGPHSDLKALTKAEEAMSSFKTRAKSGKKTKQESPPPLRRSNTAP